MKLKSILFLIACVVCNTSYSQNYQSQNTTLLSHWTNPNQLADSVFGDQKYNGCWGWTDTIKNKEYALIGSVTGTYFIDVTDPYNPIERAFLVGGCGDTLTNIHREIKSYSHYAYIMSQEGCDKPFQIVDMQYLPDSVHVVNDTFSYRSHTISIDETNARLYLNIASANLLNGNYYSNLHVYDLSNPEHPLFQRALEVDYPSILPAGYGHDCFARNDTIYLSGTDGYYVFTQSDTMPFNLIGSMTSYPNQGYNHSSWLTDNSRYSVMCEESPKTVIKILDLEDISSINIVGTCTSSPDTSAIHHNPFIVGNNRAVVACYTDGVQIFDFTNPTNPSKTGYFDTYYQNDNTPPDSVTPQELYRGCWGAYPYLRSKNIIALDMQNGLYMIDASVALKTEGFEKNSTTSIQISPNPASEVLKIKNITEKTTLKLYDILGSLVLETQTQNNTELNTIGLKPGVYMLTTESDNTKSVNKIIISR